MPVTIEERYKEAFTELRHASDMRVKIVGGWLAVYAALAATFAWMYSKDLKPILWIVPVLGMVATLFFWAGDYRNGLAIGAAKDVGKSIEDDEANSIPKDQRFFWNLDRGFRHGLTIGVFATLMLVTLCYVTWYLVSNSGELPSRP